jgi:hypothetical protein
MKTIFLIISILICYNAISQEFYLDSIYDERNEENTSKYFYYENNEIKEVVYPYDVWSYEYNNQTQYRINLNRRTDKVFKGYRVIKHDNSIIHDEKHYSPSGEVEYHDAFSYENDLLVEHFQSKVYILGEPYNEPDFYPYVTENYTYDENNEIVFYERDYYAYGGREVEYIRENNVLIKRNSYTNEFGHLTIDTTYYKPNENFQGWSSHGSTITDDGTACDSAFHFSNGDITREEYKRARWCTDYDTNYNITIASPSDLIPYKSYEWGSINEVTNEDRPNFRETYTIDSTAINEGKYMIHKHRVSINADGSDGTEYITQHFYTQFPDYGSYNWDVISSEALLEDFDQLVSISPNPLKVGQSLDINSENILIDEVKVLNTTGGNVGSYFLGSWGFQKNLELSINQGFYILLFYYEGEYLGTKKVIVFN